MSPALFCIFKPRYLLFWLSCISLGIYPYCLLYLSMGSFMHLHGFSNNRMLNNLFLHTLLKITCALDSPLSWTSCHQLRVCNLCLPFSRLLQNMCSCASELSPHFLIVTAKGLQWKKSLIPIMVLFLFILCVMHAVLHFFYLCPHPTFLIQSSQAGQSPWCRGYSAESWSVPGAPQCSAK